MRKQHLKLHAIYTMISKCDTYIATLNADKAKYGDTFWSHAHQNSMHRYSRIRNRLYWMYSNQLIKINEDVLR